MKCDAEAQQKAHEQRDGSNHEEKNILSKIPFHLEAKVSSSREKEVTEREKRSLLDGDQQAKILHEVVPEAVERVKIREKCGHTSK